MKAMAVTHDRKRNAQMVYGSLIRYISEATVEKREKEARRALDIARMFAPGTVLGHELGIHEAASGRLACSRDMAESILSDVIESACGVDLPTLYESLRSAYTLCESLMGVDFMDRYPYFDSKVATITQALIDSARKGNPINESKDRASIKGALISRLMSKQPPPQMTPAPERNALALRLATEGFRREYGSKLSTSQMNVLDAHIQGGAKGDYSRYARVARSQLDEATVNIRRFAATQKDDKILMERLEKVADFASKIDVFDPSTLAHVLEVQSVSQEIEK